MIINSFSVSVQLVRSPEPVVNVLQDIYTDILHYTPLNFQRVHFLDR